jgi:2-C-methyl-D-erythritol 4-phosphate cytidylyltransferase
VKVGSGSLPRVWCVVPAAGSGSRFGAEKPKQYMVLGDKPLIEVTLERLFAHPAVAGAVVALAAGDRWWPGITTVAGRPVLTVTGGASRAESVLAALRALPDEVGAEDWVAVHDAARPCVSVAELDSLFSFCFRSGSPALLAVPVRDTIKRASTDGTVAATVPRENLWRAQTPQCAPRTMLERALSASLDRARTGTGSPPTDESNALEEMSVRVCLVEGKDSNIKVTTAPDLDWARFWLSQENGVLR